MAIKSKIASRMVGYSLAIFLTTAIILALFWILVCFYDVTLIIDSDTHVKIQELFQTLSFVFLIILGFTFFSPLVSLFLRGIYHLQKGKRKKSILKTIAKNEGKIIYSATLGYWFLFTFALTIYFVVFLCI